MIKLTESCHTISRIGIEYNQIRLVSHAQQYKIVPTANENQIAELNQTVKWTVDQMNQNS